jgi:hypothetical protein
MVIIGKGKRKGGNRKYPNDETGKELHFAGTKACLPCKHTKERVGTGCSTRERAKQRDRDEEDQSGADSAGFTS